MISQAPIKAIKRRAAYTLVEVMVSVAIFGLAMGGICEIATTVLFQIAKNTGVNISHNTFQWSLDFMAEQLRASPQIVDMAQYSTTFVKGFYTVPEAASNPAAQLMGQQTTANAIRFVRILPVNFFVPPNDGSTFTELSPQDPSSASYPNYLKSGGKSLTVTYTTQAANLASPDFVADLAGARLYIRFPYLSETDPAADTSYSYAAQFPGLALASPPTLAGISQTLALANPLPANVPSCNQAYLVVISAFATLMAPDGQSAQLIYYPDVSHMARSKVLATTFCPQTIQQGSAVVFGQINPAPFQSTNYGPFVFGISPTSGSPSNPTARAAVNITLPVYAPGLDNTVVRRGGAAAMSNVSITIPVQVRRRAFF